MTKQTKQQTYKQELEDLGFTVQDHKSSRYIKMSHPAFKSSIFLGRAGAVRVGRIASDTRSVPLHELEAEHRAQTEEHEMKPKLKKKPWNEEPTFPGGIEMERATGYFYGYPSSFNGRRIKKLDRKVEAGRTDNLGTRERFIFENHLQEPDPYELEYGRGF